MTDQVVTLRIVGENGKLVAAVRGSTAELDKLGKAADESGQRARAGATGVDRFGDSAQRTRARVRGLSGTLGEMKASVVGLVGTFAGIQGLGMLGRTVDTYSDIIGKLDQATDSEAALARAKADTFRIAQQTYQQLEATVTLYQRSNQALEQYGVSQTKVAQLTQAINQGLLVSRATTAEAAATALQLSQALGAGALRGEEFNAVNEAAPRLMKALAESMDVPRGALKKLAEEGKLTIDVLLKAWTGPEADRIAEEAAQVPLTISRAWQTTKNDVLRYVGEIDQGMGTSRAIAQGIALIGRNVGLLVGVVATAATALALFYARGALALGIQKLTALWAAHSVSVNRSMVSVVGLTGATTRLTVAQTAASIATRGLNAGLALVGGPLGVFVLTVGAAAVGINALVEAEEKRQQEFAEGIETTRAMTAEVRELIAARADLASQSPVTVNDAIALQDKAGAKLRGEEAELQDLRQQLASAERKLQAADVGRFSADIQMAQQASAAYAHYSAEVDILRAAIEDLAPETDALRAATEDLTAANDPAMTLALTAAGDAMRSFANDPSIVPGLYQQVRGFEDLASGADLLAAALERISTADALAKTINADLQQAGDAARQQAAEVGKTAVEVAQAKAAEAEAAARAAGWTEQQLVAQRASNQAAIEGLAALQAAKQAEKERQEQAREAEQAAGRAAREAQRLAEEQATSQARYVAELERADALLAGPLAVAQVEHRQRVDELDAALAAHNITWTAYLGHLAVADEQLARTTGEIEREQDVMGQARADYRQMIGLLQMSAAARRVEQEVIQRVNAAKDAGREMSAGEIEDLKRFIAEQSRVVDMIDASAEAAAEYRRMWNGAIDSVAAAFGDWMTGGISSFEDFGDALVDIARRFVSDIIRELASAALKRTFASWGNWLMSAMGAGSGGGAGGAGGGWLNTILGLFGGGGAGGGSSAGIWSTTLSGFTSGFSAAGAAGGGFWSQLVGGFQGAVSAFTGSLAGATTATTAFSGSLAGFGTVSNLAGVAGAGASLGAGGSAAGAGAAAGASGAAAAVSWIPIVGWIIAGMMANDAAYKEGWRIQGQKTDMAEYYAKKGWIMGSIDTAAIGGADQLLQSLGVSERWASLISGSSLHTKLWGHQMPTVQSTGVQGVAGLSGFEGQAFANVKAEGGWFRSDDWWQETGELAPAIDRMFDQVAERIGDSARALADQMGADLSSALAAVQVDIGQIVLDKDPEKAREQIEQKLAEVMTGLASGAVEALGFGRLLDDGFAATEVMGALSASIALVTGGADELGRALTALEKENVARAVEWIGDRAVEHGTTLGQELGQVVNTLGEYANLISGVDAQLRTADLNAYQRAQLDIELGYRNQVQQANELAKSLGLSGARAEDLAKIEALRAHNMASLQRQMEAQKDTFLEDLGLGDLSTLRDDQKLAESMQLLRDAVQAGDLQRAQQLAQQSLDLGRDLYASGADYAGLYNEVTGLVDGMGADNMAGFTEAQLDEIADLLTDLPGNIASALFNTLYGPATRDGPTPWTPPAPVEPPGTNIPPGLGGGWWKDTDVPRFMAQAARPPALEIGRPGGPNPRTEDMLRRIADSLAAVERNTGGSLAQQRSDSLEQMNRKERA